MSKLPKVSIIVLTWNQLTLTLEELENLGFAGGNNVGLIDAIKRGADYVLFLNNDVILPDDLLVQLVKVAESNEKIGLVAPKIYFAKGFEFHKKRYKKSDLGKVIWYAGGQIDWQNIIGIHLGVDEIDQGQFKKRKISFATGCCMLISADVFHKIGMLDEKYFLYLEDMDLSYRAQKAGFKILFEPSAIIWHKNAASAGGSGSRLQEYYFTRNRLLFTFRYAKLKTKLALLRHIIKKSTN